MLVLANNLRYLRDQLKMSQQALADSLSITRGRYSKYEDDAAQPPLEILIKISKYHRISIDLLLTVDLKKYSLEDIINLPDNRIVLPIKIDSRGENRIEVIPYKASMGYLNGYSDPEYIDTLQTISLPFLGPGKYRAFPAEGDSMPPHKDGAYIVGSYVEQLSDLKKDKGYVFITRGEGITYKKLVELKDDRIVVKADNDFYHPYDILLTDILEIWKYGCSIATEEYNRNDFILDNQTVIKMFNEIKNKIEDLKN